MKKKHYASEGKRHAKMMHHSHGMEVHGHSKVRGTEHGMSDGEYAGVDARRRLEYEDSQMIHEDRAAVANLPQGVMMKSYPNSYGRNPYPELDDTITGIDRQVGQDEAGMRKFRSDTKY